MASVCVATPSNVATFPHYDRYLAWSSGPLSSHVHHRRAQLGPAPIEQPNAHKHFAVLLQLVRGKTSPQRFLLSDRERKHRMRGRLLQEDELESFFESLDARLLPASFAKSELMFEVWRRFWEIRSESWGLALARYIAEARKFHGRTIDLQADTSELFVLEKRIVSVFAPSDRAAVLKQARQQGVDEADAAITLWSTHLSSWRSLVLREDPIAEVGARRGSSSTAVPRTTTAPAAARPTSEGPRPSPIYAVRIWKEIE